jgi:hypothetical protein
MGRKRTVLWKFGSENSEAHGIRRQDMLKPGLPIQMTKGYKGVKGVILKRTRSEFELYVLKLHNGIHLIAGPSAFIGLEG